MILWYFGINSPLDVRFVILFWGLALIPLWRGDFKIFFQPRCLAVAFSEIFFTNIGMFRFCFTKIGTCCLKTKKNGICFFWFFLFGPAGPGDLTSGPAGPGDLTHNCPLRDWYDWLIRVWLVDKGQTSS